MTCRACGHDRDRHGPEAGGCIECRCSDTFVRRVPLTFVSAGDLLSNDGPLPCLNCGCPWGSCLVHSEFCCDACAHFPAPSAHPLADQEATA